jgi:hypothetical protein
MIRDLLNRYLGPMHKPAVGIVGGLGLVAVAMGLWGHDWTGMLAGLAALAAGGYLAMLRRRG